MADETPKRVTEDQMTAAWAANVKSLFDQHLEDIEQGKTIGKGWAALALRQAEADHQIVLQMAQNGAALANRVNNDAASISAALNTVATQQLARDQSTAAFLQTMVAAGAFNQQTADNAMSGKLAAQFEGTITKALDAAVAAATQTAPPAQGTTGVAQGATQAMTATANNAMMSELAAMVAALQAQQVKLAEVIGVLLVRVAGEEVKPLTTPAAA